MHISSRVKAGWTSCHSSQNCRFPERQIIQIFSEVIIRCRFDAMVSVAEVDGVKVSFKDLIFGILAFKLNRKVSLLYLSFICPFRR